MRPRSVSTCVQRNARCGVSCGAGGMWDPSLNDPMEWECGQANGRLVWRGLLGAGMADDGVIELVEKPSRFSDGHQGRFFFRCIKGGLSVQDSDNDDFFS